MLQSAEGIIENFEFDWTVDPFPPFEYSHYQMDHADFDELCTTQSCNKTREIKISK